MKNLYAVLKSLRTANILIAVLMVVLIAGAVQMPLSPAFKTINSTSLFKWLRETPLSVTWWLWASIGILVLIVINTVVCTIDSIIKKQESKRWLLVIAPQVIHLGFCLIMLGHLLSSYGSFHGFAVMNEGSGLRLDSGLTFYLDKIDYKTRQNYITEMEAVIRYINQDGTSSKVRISPNHPALIGGVGVYLKEVALNPFPRALIQVSHEPGAVWALSGGILFLAGTVLLVLLKLKLQE